ncbi:MAG: flexitail domain-containing putative surface protein, partial [Dehalococcoidia bacterium]|nr:flexitail domain-containing putative surface protein [Dehalococcoidia bacterium]
AFNSIGTNLGPGAGNIGFYSSGFSRVRQGGSPTDTRLPLDGSQPNQLVVVSGTAGSAGSDTLTSAGSFTSEDFSPPGYNFRLNNPSQKGSEYIVTITGGDGHRQTRRIASNTADTLTLEADWGVVPSAGDLFEVYEIVAMPEAINPSAGYSSNWNNKAATADDGDDFGREHRNIFIAERLAADSDWTRDEQRQLNEDLAGLDGKGKFGRYLIPRIRQAVDGVGNGGNPNVDTVLAALETHNGSPLFGRGFLDPVTDTAIAGETLFLESLIDEVWNAIYADEFSSTGIGVGKTTRLNMLQHAIDSAAGGPAGAYAEAYTGDYFNSADWRVVVRDAFSATVTNLGGVPADIDRPDSTYVHPLSAVYPNLVWNPTPIGNRGHYEQIVEVGPTVRGEFIFSLGQSAFIDSDGLPDPNVDTLHDIWRDWRFVPMLHVAEDLASDPDGDIDNDGVLDGFEKWYFGSNSPAPTADADSDGLNLQEEFLNASDPTDSETDGDALDDGADNCPSAYNPGQEDLDGDDIGDDCDRDKDGEGCRDARELINNEMRGGKRSPDNPYDLYDINGDKLVDLFIDIFGVAAAFGEGPGGPNYTAAKDRSPAPMGQDPWDMGPPDNVIDLFVDIFGVANQFGHDCAA